MNRRAWPDARSVAWRRESDFMNAAPNRSPSTRSGAKELLLRLRGRPDSEHEMSFNRVTIVIVMLLCIAAVNPRSSAVLLLIGYWLASVAVFAHILFDNAVRVWRRLGVMIMDMAVISYCLYSNGANAAAFWPLYLWVIFGNGFRFGNPYLFSAAATATAFFAIVVAKTVFWRDAIWLSAGLLTGMVVLPAYASKLISKLSNAKLKAEEANRAKSYFLASVSHELRTPLTAIIGLGSHLRDSDVGAEERGMAETIVTAGRSLLSLINQLLDFSRLGSKGINAAAEPYELTSLLVSVRELMQGVAGAKGLRIALHINSGMPLSLIGDEFHLREVLVNLVSNAIKFTDEGCVTISADCQRTAAGEMKLLLSVTDTGIGIDSKAQGHIFESFRQADETIIDRFGGTGLGLAICKQVAELLGGEIGVESAPGQGSRFWFTSKTQIAPTLEGQKDSPQLVLISSDAAAALRLGEILQPSGIIVGRVTSPEEARRLIAQTPAVLMIDEREFMLEHLSLGSLREQLGSPVAPILLARPRGKGKLLPARVQCEFASTVTTLCGLEPLLAAIGIARAFGQRTISPAGQPISQARHPRRVLIADDNSMNQKVFGMILKRAGHQVETAQDGERALDIMKEEGVDLVLMDVNMPVLNGIEATKLYRFMALGRRRIPIVGITADASPETSERCLSAGMDACVSKPIEPAQLLELIDDLTDCSPAAAAPVFDPAGIVTPLFQGRQDDASAINWDKVDELADLGGPEFVEELLAEYVVDTKSLLEAIRDSVASADLEGFRNGTHALRSSGANIGAEKVAQMCLHLQRIGREEFEVKSVAHLRTLELELQRVRDALATRDWAKRLAVGR